MDIHELLGNLSVAKQQLVAIARAISLSSRLLIMDEPTAALSFSEVRMLYEIIRKLKKENIAILFISHKLDEVFEVSDRGLCGNAVPLDPKVEAETAEADGGLRFTVKNFGDSQNVAVFRLNRIM